MLNQKEPQGQYIIKNRSSDKIKERVKNEKTITLEEAKLYLIDFIDIPDNRKYEVPDDWEKIKNSKNITDLGKVCLNIKNTKIRKEFNKLNIAYTNYTPDDESLISCFNNHISKLSKTHNINIQAQREEDVDNYIHEYKQHKQVYQDLFNDIANENINIDNKELKSELKYFIKIFKLCNKADQKTIEKLEHGINTYSKTAHDNENLNADDRKKLKALICNDNIKNIIESGLITDDIKEELYIKYAGKQNIKKIEKKKKKRIKNEKDITFNEAQLYLSKFITAKINEQANPIKNDIKKLIEYKNKIEQADNLDDLKQIFDSKIGKDKDAVSQKIHQEFKKLKINDIFIKKESKKSNKKINDIISGKYKKDMDKWVNFDDAKYYLASLTSSETKYEKIMQAKNIKELKEAVNKSGQSSSLYKLLGFRGKTLDAFNKLNIIVYDTENEGTVLEMKKKSTLDHCQITRKLSTRERT